MTIVLAAVDNSVASKPVLATARALASPLDAQTEAVHVRTNGDRTAHGAAAAAGVPLRILDPPVVDALVEAASADEVAAVVVGARRLPSDPRPLGATALAVATALAKPVVVVPPDADPREAFRRVLVPLEGTISSSLAPRSVFELAQTASIDVVALHVHDAEEIPSFTDQPQHENAAWAQEFLARYCPWGIGVVELATRVGSSAAIVPLFAQERDADLIALGWSQTFEAGRAPVVRAALERSGIPVMLVPVVRAGASRASRALAEATV